jgi:uncharacterized membrane protein YdbT with pleckstrin-like domain
MEEMIWKGRASWLSMFTLTNIFLAMLTVGLWLIVPVIRILSVEYEISSQRVTVTKGLISRDMDQVELVRLKDIRMSQGVLGRIMRYGDVVLLSGDASHATKKIQGVPDPMGLREKIRAASDQQKKEKGVRLQEWM